MLTYPFRILTLIRQLYHQRFSALVVGSALTEVLDRCRAKRKQARMDDYMFKVHLDECRTVDEATSYVEIFNYTVSGVYHHLLANLKVQWLTSWFLERVEP